MNVVYLDNHGQQKAGHRTAKYRDKNIIWTRDKQIINIQPKYNLDSVKVNRTRPQKVVTDNSGVFKTPINFPKKRPGTSSSAQPKSSSSVPTDGKSSSGPETAESYVILALTSGRGDANCEIGMAAMDLQYPHLIISQISDTQTFTNTLANINLFQPLEIVMPDTMCIADELRCNLFSTIRDKYKQILISAISRQHFNKAEGLERVKTHTSDAYSPIELVIKEKYYALAATAALFKYIEHIQHITHAPKSMKVEFQCSENKMLIDVDSAQNLELVSCLTSFPKHFNLFGALNRCQTRIGRCQLRASILQPSCDEDFIKQRQNCVTELLENRQLHTLLIPTLRRLGGIDKLLHGLCVKTLITADDDNVKIAERKLNYILTLKNTLETVPELQKLLENTKAEIFKKIYSNLSDSRFQLMLDQILEIVHKDAQCVSGYTSSNMQRCFAIKSGKSDMLDVARQTYCELIDNMKDEVENYGKKYRMDLSLACSSMLGYHIQMPIPKRMNFDISDLPKTFINVEKKRNIVYMTTSTLLVMSLHCREVSEELHVMSSVLLEELMGSLRESIVCLYQLGADIAELDQIASLARISAIPEFVEPVFKQRIKVEQSRHPVRYILGNEDIIANDINVSTAYNLAIITGPNMSGKSTYLKQIVLLQIMAQIGCRVPAKAAEFRIADRIFCHISPRNSLECNASTFVMEMKEVQHMLKSLSKTSLIILDEPCNSTAVDEGTALAWTICATLALSSAFTFVSTHFLFLTQIANVYFNIVNFHLECLLVQDSNGILDFKYKLRPGITPISNYGIAVLKMSAMPRNIIENAEKLAKELSSGIKKISFKAVSEPEPIDEICYKYYARFVELEENGQLDYASAYALMEEIRKHPRKNEVKLVEKPKQIHTSSKKDTEVTSNKILTEESSNKNIQVDNMSENDGQSKIKSPQIETVLQVTESKIESISGQSKTNEISITSKETNISSEKESFSEGKKVSRTPEVLKSNFQNKVDYDISVDSLISQNYKNLSISSLNSSSRYPKKPCRQESEIGKSELSFYDQPSTSKQSLSHKMEVFRASIGKERPSTSINSFTSSKSLSKLSVFKNKYDQTTILRSFSQSNLNPVKPSKVNSQHSLNQSKYSDENIDTSATVRSQSCDSNISKDFQSCFLKQNYDQSYFHSQASTVDMFEMFGSKQDNDPKTNLLFSREIFENSSIQNDLSQNVSFNLSQSKSNCSLKEFEKKLGRKLSDTKSYKRQNENRSISNLSFSQVQNYSTIKNMNVDLKKYSSKEKTSDSSKLKSFSTIELSDSFSMNDSAVPKHLNFSMSSEKSTSQNYYHTDKTTSVPRLLNLPEEMFKSPTIKKRKIENIKIDSFDDVRIMTSSALKEAEIFRQIEGKNFDENMFYEPIQQNISDIDDTISFCQCSQSSIESSQFSKKTF